MKTIFLCEDLLDGILTGVYEAWDSRLGHDNVQLDIRREMNLELFCEYRNVETDYEKSGKVLRTIYQKLGDEAGYHICQASACADPRKANAIYHMVVLGLHLKTGKKVTNFLSDESVATVMELSLKAWNEAHRLMGFVRFQELKNGVLFSRVHPTHQVLPLIAPHFADRFTHENWMIFDEGRGQIAVHEKDKQWVMLHGEELNENFVSQFSEEERDFEQLWKSFCTSIAIEGRKNLNLQRQLLPLKFRPNMTEFR